MFHSEESPMERARKVVERYQQQLRFARAVELARVGQDLMALELICPDGTPPNRPEELDLLARIYARQWNYRAAIRSWEQALKQDAGNPIYALGLETAKERFRQRLIFYPIILGSLIFLFILATAHFVIYASHYQP